MDFDISREWLETNGIGGFASSTVVGCNTRRYHALLCAATRPPLGRMVLVNKIDESLMVGGHNFDLGCNQYPGAINPVGFHYLREFIPAPVPRWIYALPASAAGESVVLQKTLWMPHGQNTTVVRYELLEGTAAHLTVHPFITGRDYHGIHHYNPTFNTGVAREEDGGGNCHVTLYPYEGCPPIIFSLNGAFYEGGAWYYSFEYAIERERGLDFQEDAYCPGAFNWHLTADEPAVLVASTQPVEMDVIRASYEKELARRNALTTNLKTPAGESVCDGEAQRLAAAADQFIVQRASDGLYTAMAGYHWFSDWGRDTMIALPGLCLSTGRYDIARSILLAFAKAASQGMIPNRFPDAGDTPEYNTVDATLWFFHAVAAYLARSGDWETVGNELYPVLRDCIEWHIKGTRYGIKADEADGLLHSGEEGTQLTWMDAKVGDWVVTPRTGKAVEIQALWYNALCTMTDLAERANDQVTRTLCEEWSGKAKAGFQDTFWNEQADSLYDVVNGDFKDGAIRPNQIFAVSLPHRLITADYEKRIVATVQRELLTPFGLRSLSPRDSHYKGIYLGDQTARDGCYHQGTVWGWLIGPFLSAYLHVNDSNDAAKTQVRDWLRPLLGHLDQACLGSISEIFDGDSPHNPRGCCAQAWSIAEVLRVWVDELN